MGEQLPGKVEATCRTQLLLTSGSQVRVSRGDSVIDRLSILALRIYHLRERGAGEKLAISRRQLSDLTTAGQQLTDDLFAGRKRQKTYRALKLYNGPAMNPYLNPAT